MPQTCSHCHAQLATDNEADWCPACGGALIETASIPGSNTHPAADIDHRGIVLPRRHALGGIITPQ